MTKQVYPKAGAKSSAKGKDLGGPSISDANAQKAKLAFKRGGKVPDKFEQSKFDNDKGMKEGSKKDMARDRKEKVAMKKAKR